MSANYIDKPIVEQIAQPVFDWLHRKHGLPVTAVAVELWMGVVASGILSIWMIHRTTASALAVFITSLFFLFFVTGFLLRAQKRHRDWETSPERMSGTWPAATRNDAVIRVIWLGMFCVLGIPRLMGNLAEGEIMMFLIHVCHDLLITAALYADACPTLPPSSWQPKKRLAMQTSPAA